jgi:hypothetical protein
MLSSWRFFVQRLSSELVIGINYQSFFTGTFSDGVVIKDQLLAYELLRNSLIDCSFVALDATEHSWPTPKS